MSEELSKALREQIQNRIDEQIEDVKRTALKYKIEQLTGEVLGELHNRGMDTDRENVNMDEIVRECVLDAMFGDEVSAEFVEISVGGRNNHGRSTEVRMDTDGEPRTYTEKVPIEGGDDPETVEVERVEPSSDPRLNGDLNSSEIARAFREGLTPDIIRGKHRMNDDGTSEESDPEDVSEAGQPWYQ